MIRSSASVPLYPGDQTHPQIKRSGGRLSDLASIGNDDIVRSSSGQSAFHLSSSASGGAAGTPSSHRRRSTETSGSGGGLDYYWSNAAGIGPSSSSSSLAMSPSPSAGLVELGSSEGARRKGLYRRSEASLRDLIAQEQRRAEGLADERAGGAVALESPTWSGESDYSGSGSPLDPTPGSAGSGRRYPGEVNVWNISDGSGDGDDYNHARQSVGSTSTTKPSKAAPENGNDQHRTPLLGQSDDRPETRSPGFTYASDSLHATPIVSQTNFNRAQPSPSSYTPGSGRLDSAGIRRGGSPASTGTGVSPGIGPVIATELVEEPSGPQLAPPWQSEFGLGMGTIGEEAREAEDTTIKSRGREKRATLPAMPLDLASGSGGDLLSPEKRQRGTGSPQPPPRSALRTQLAGITSPLPNLAFDYNPSLTRGTHSPLNLSPPTRDVSRLSHSSTPTSSPPMSREPSTDQPGLPSRLHPTAARSTNSVDSQGSINDLTDLLGGAIDEIGLIDSRETPPPMIAADSRDKPRPNPLNLDPNALASEIGADGEEGRRPITPRSLPSRGESLSSAAGSVSAGSSSGGGSASVPAPNPGSASAAPVQGESRYIPPISASANHMNPQHQRQTSVSTLHAPGSGTAGGFSTRPWPAAMLFGHIKNMKHAGDRAKYYAKGINDLAVADSGLRDWCVISASSAHRVPPARVPLNRLQSNMSMSPPSSSRHEFTPSIHIQPALPSSLSLSSQSRQPSSHPRSVSSGSEFPMREDSYTAREISQRVIDPGDEPTSLPPNLPYPQLQQVRNGGMRNSPSVASMASMASTATGTTAVGSGGGSGSGGSGSGNGKRGFFSALRGKKDSGGLGPPTGPVNTNTGSSAGGAGKKDVRGLKISNPERSSLSGPTPLGPRAPRMGGGSYGPDGEGQGRNSIDGAGVYRGSLDMEGMRGLTPPSSAGAGRASFDSSSIQQQQQRAGLGARLQQAAAGQIQGHGQLPKEEDVRAMQDVLPHVDRGVLRAYLSKYGDQMSAITAYFEDEKRAPTRA